MSDTWAFETKQIHAGCQGDPASQASALPIVQSAAYRFRDSAQARALFALEELGFVPGEHVAVLARAMPGADPLVVRIGQSTFALRRAEADCVQLADGSQDGLTVALPTGAAHA